jgi:hypothetical protein
MALSLDQLKQAFKKPEQTEGGSRPNNYYPFWNIAEGQQAIVRFLPDKTEDNPFGFVVEKLMHTLVINGENKSIPCLKMHGEDCPICKVSSEYYKKEDKENGKKYWRKKQHIAQAIIIEDPLKADETTGETHQGKVRFLALGYQLFQVIQAAFESGDLDEVPYNMDGGYDFVIKKTKQGEYSTYAVGSRFKAKPRSLTDEEREVAEEQMIHLSTLLPANPGEDKVAGQLNAALTGAEYADSTPAKKAATSSKATLSDEDADDAPAPVAAKKTTKVVEQAVVDGPDEADEILASIRNRRQSKV